VLILALDTTTRAGSVALARDDEVLDAMRGDPARTHGERLPRDVAILLDRRRVPVSAIDLFAVAAGPGSFTGLRVGIATVQGLALVNGRLVAAVPALEALAVAAALDARLAGGQIVAAWLAGGRGEVFAGLYRIGVADGFPAALEAEPPVARRPAAWLEAHRDRLPQIARFAGDGAIAFRAELAAAGVSSVQVPDDVPPLAPTIARLGFRRALAGDAVAPHAIEPIYVRRSDAELARDRRGGGSTCGTRLERRPTDGPLEPRTTTGSDEP
jgi:tRNA threonylcarbamoyladenosine biosynthesis protein TsaB